MRKNELWDFSLRFITPTVRRLLPEPGDASALELGCGDGRRLDAAARLFTPDIEWITQHYGTINGSAAAAANINGRPRGSVSRHCIGNFVVDLEDRDHARSQTSVTIWAVDGGDEPPELPIRLDRPRSVIDFHHRFVRTARGWRIAGMRSHLIFVTE